MKNVTKLVLFSIGITQILSITFIQGTLPNAARTIATPIAHHLATTAQATTRTPLLVKAYLLTAFATPFVIAAHESQKPAAPITQYDVNKYVTNQLFQAVDKDDAHAIKQLQKTGGVDFNSQIHDYMPVDPLRAAVLGHKHKALKALLYAGANPNACDGFNRTALHAAIKTNNVHGFNLLLQNNRTNLDHKDALGRTALDLAIKLESTFHATELLKAGANPNTLNMYSDTPLHIAVGQGNRYLASALLQTGKVDVNYQNHAGHTPLHIAAYSNKTDACLLNDLLKAGANPTITSSYGETPLHLAVEQDRYDLVRYMLETGKFKINAQDNRGNTALHKAAQNDNPSMVEILLDAGADATIKNNLKSRTPYDLTTDPKVKQLLQTHSKELEQRKQQEHQNRIQINNSTLPKQPTKMRKRDRFRGWFGL